MWRAQGRPASSLALVFPNAGSLVRVCSDPVSSLSQCQAPAHTPPAGAAVARPGNPWWGAQPRHLLKAAGEPSRPWPDPLPGGATQASRPGLQRPLSSAPPGHCSCFPFALCHAPVARRARCLVSCFPGLQQRLRDWTRSSSGQRTTISWALRTLVDGPARCSRRGCRRPGAGRPQEAFRRVWLREAPCSCTPASWGQTPGAALMPREGLPLPGGSGD